jgi:hypothetical protein
LFFTLVAGRNEFINGVPLWPTALRKNSISQHILRLVATSKSELISI